MKNFLGFFYCFCFLSLFFLCSQPVFSASSKSEESTLTYSHGYARDGLGTDHYLDKGSLKVTYTANTASDVETNGMTLGDTVSVTKNVEINFFNEGADWDTPLGCFCDDYSTGCANCKTFDDKEDIDGAHSGYWQHYVSDYASADPNLVGRATWTATPIPGLSIAGDGTIISCNASTWVCSAVGVGNNGKIYVNFGATNLRFDNQVYARTCPESDSDCPSSYESDETKWDMRFEQTGIGFHSSHPVADSDCASGYRDYKKLCGYPYLNYSLNSAALVEGRAYNPIALPQQQIVFTIKGLEPPVAGICGEADGVETTFPPTSDLCDEGGPSAVSECPNTSGNYTWTCDSTGGLDDTSCSAPYKVYDSKVRYYHDGIKKIAAEVAGKNSVVSNLKVYSDGNIHYLATWDEDTNCTGYISTLKVKTTAGIRYLGIVP